MGLLSQGTPLRWAEASKYADHVRKHGIQQLLTIYHKIKDNQGDELKWGDEVEYMVVKFDDKSQRATLSLRSKDILAKLNSEEEETKARGEDPIVLWHPEYGAYMLESTPSKPYGNTIKDMLAVEPNMARRRESVRDALAEDEALLALCNFPRMGCPNFTTPAYKPSPGGDVSKSLFFPDEAINNHPRFSTLTANIRERRGCKVAMNMPIFRDKATPMPFSEEFDMRDACPERGAAAKDDHIYMDAMGFGMGCCCLQVTFQACNIEEARHLYDQLAVVAPVVLALSAASPIFRGHLSEVDCRWNVIAGSVDDRTCQERGLAPLTTDRFRIKKSRYDSIDSYISDGPMYKAKYNDIDLVYDHDIQRKLSENGIDPLLAKHFAHLFIRDPLVIYKELLDQDDEKSSDHFENIQSTNWQTMRFKPPPPGSDIGWRVEFRPTEVQLTDFENAAFVVFTVLLTRTILSLNLNLYIPLSKVDENMHVAHARGAVTSRSFYFRRNLSDAGCLPPGSPAMVPDESDPDAYAPMSADQIINGIPGQFPGLIPLIEVYLSTINVDLESRCTIDRYLALISKRASGELMTTASWIRDFVRSHPEYKQDSAVSEKINYDLMKACDALGRGELPCPKLLGDLFPTKQPKPCCE